MINFELLDRDKYQKNGLVGVNLGEGKVTKGYPIDDVHHYQAKMCKYASHVPKVNYCKFLCYICLLIVSGSIMRIIFTYFPSSKRGCVFPIVICPMGQYRINDHPYHASQFSFYKTD